MASEDDDFKNLTPKATGAEDKTILRFFGPNAPEPTLNDWVWWQELADFFDKFFDKLFKR